MIGYGMHDALQAMGPQAAHIVDLWRIFLFLCTGVTAIVVVTMLVALWRAPRARTREPPDLSMVNRAERGPRRAVTFGLAASTVGLLVLIGASVLTDRALARLSLEDAVTIEVVGHQWWWTVRYMGQRPTDTFTTANEIHVPVGRPVVVKLESDDVIHSLWIPSLSGKRDLIPGRTALMKFRADTPGRYEGRCAEFCGYQHAKMAFAVHAHPPDVFEAWRQQQLQPAAEPSDAQAIRGKALFQSVSCAMCHAIQGTLAQGKRAPDLTHVASRLTLAAGALPNTPQHLTRWIADPQQHKPGANMPATPLAPEDLASIVAYLGTLK
jgi:cytochrome c oxidase subunit 2